jgi:hypothetical protein
LTQRTGDYGGFGVSWRESAQSPFSLLDAKGKPQLHMQRTVSGDVAVAASSGSHTYTGEGAWGFRLDPAGVRVVESPALDELTDLFGGSADFVKMDIEGSEWEVVPAPGEWLERVGSLLIEIHGNEGRRQAGIDEMMVYLRAKGFTCEKPGVHWSAVWAKRSPT